MQNTTSTNLDAASRKEVQIPVENTGKNSPDVLMSARQPAWHVVILTFFTLNTYFFYWMFKTWRDLHAHAARLAAESALKAAGQPVTAGGATPAPVEPPALGQFVEASALLRTICLFIPVLNMYWIYKLFAGVCRLNPRPASFVSQHPRLIGGSLTAVALLILWQCGRHDHYFLTSCLIGIPCAFIQHWLNAYWQSVEPQEAVMRRVFTIKELIVLFLGMLWLGFITFGLMMGVKAS